MHHRILKFKDIHLYPQTKYIVLKWLASVIVFAYNEIFEGEEYHCCVNEMNYIPSIEFDQTSRDSFHNHQLIQSSALPCLPPQSRQLAYGRTLSGV